MLKSLLKFKFASICKDSTHFMSSNTYFKITPCLHEKPHMKIQKVIKVKFCNRIENKIDKGLGVTQAIDTTFITLGHIRPKCCCIPKTTNIKYCDYHSSFTSSNFDQGVPRTTDEVKEVLGHEPVSPPDSKLLKVAIIGIPNSGKSTLINELIGWRVCSVSRKVHTTQCSARAVCRKGATQLVFLDTPGVLTPEEIKKYRPKHSLVIDPELSLQQADLVAVLHDVSNRYTRSTLHPRILRLLTLYHTIPSILILNKLDILKDKKLLLEITRNLTEGVVGKVKHDVESQSSFDEKSLRESLHESADTEDASSGSELKPERKVKLSEYETNSVLDLEPTRNAFDVLDETSKASWASFQEESADFNLNLGEVLSGTKKLTEKQVQRLIAEKKGWPSFNEVFMVSALNGLGVEDVRNYFISVAKERKWIFSDDVVTDQSPQEIAMMTVREKCLEVLNQNIPYELKFSLMHWELSESDVLSILICVYCPKKIYLKYLIGPAGRNVKAIAAQAEQDLRNTFRTEVRLRINVEYKELK